MSLRARTSTEAPLNRNRKKKQIQWRQQPHDTDSDTAKEDLSTEEIEEVQHVGGGNGTLEVIDKSDLDSPVCSIYVKRSVNLISCGSNAGKTTYCRDILLNRHIYFEKGSVEKIIYVNCNTTNNYTHHENPFEDHKTQLPEIETYNLLDITDVASILQVNAVVILDDVLFVNETINYLITYAANHMECIVFIITQSCISSKLFQLVYKVHTLTLFFKNSSSIRLSHYLLSQFYASPDTKKYLKHIFAEAEKIKSIVLLKLNTVASSSPTYQKVLVFANLQQLVNKSKPYCLVYPELGYLEDLLEDYAKMDVSQLDENQFILTPAKYVHIKDAGGNETSPVATKELECTEKTNWLEMNDYLKNEIQSVFPMKRWKSVLNFCREMLRIKQFCISSDYRRIMIRKSKKVNVAVIDLLSFATRRSFPTEQIEKCRPYIPFVKLMIKNKVPLSYIQNKKLIEACTNPN